MKKNKEQKTSKKSWFIRQIDHEVIITANKAAKKLGLYTYQFVSMAITEKGQEVLTGKKEIARPEDFLDVLKDMSIKFENLSSKVDSLQKPRDWRFWK